MEFWSARSYGAMAELFADFDEGIDTQWRAEFIRSQLPFPSISQGRILESREYGVDCFVRDSGGSGRFLTLKFRPDEDGEKRVLLKSLDSFTREK